ncbi:uncharacterized protein MONBRDRAFT_33481 [Monosiga brevicollis MX1]|uniref:NADH dehydrogenase [ubiquinone] 1 beta subcomplex subunit 7 n=1 Tax=Monosiga brevicollis TaxID=81824 RepID=A9V5L7_MONBE|nr:uncharacterized protein MONBRDRAFT_33481 [Monosiga brevicollis MX1]EDQ87062.1 predicted protein [Monosiga brevicollis MX1]|eukprot:XP_001748005.1 hypothetical protein [Monosiga brevicollis MX1]
MGASASLFLSVLCVRALRGLHCLLPLFAVVFELSWDVAAPSMLTEFIGWSTHQQNRKSLPIFNSFDKESHRLLFLDAQVYFALKQNTGGPPSHYRLFPLSLSLSVCTTMAAAAAGIKVSPEELRENKVPLAFRDACADFLISLNKCRTENRFLPWKCEHQMHEYEGCQYGQIIAVANIYPHGSVQGFCCQTQHSRT